jgi:putative transposase
MRRPRYSEAFILEVLRSAEYGLPVGLVCRRYQISAHTFHRWKAAYGNCEMSESQRLRQVLEENRRLRALVSELTTDNQALLSVVTQPSGESQRA